MSCIVSVCITAYNHERYLGQCLNSILCQEMDGEFEILVHDDASTDGTADLVRRCAQEHPDMVRPILQEQNQYTLGNRMLPLSELVPRSRGKYIALCEGDDFWTDPRKLQRQAEILDAHPGVVACMHTSQIVDEGGTALEGRQFPPFDVAPGEMDGRTYIQECFRRNSHFYQTSSIMFRRSAVEQILGQLPAFLTISYPWDRAFCLYLGTEGNIWYLDQVMSCYRIFSEGSWSQSMVSSREKKYQSNLGMIAMAEAFDLYTAEAYHEEIDRYLDFFRFYIAMYELDGRTMKEPRYREWYEQLSTRQKIYYACCARVPILGKLWRGLKRSLHHDEI